MHRIKHLAAAFALLTLAGPAFTGLAQPAQPKPELLLYHPSAPLSYEVATIKPIDANTADGMVRLSPGVTRRPLSPLNLRRYIMNAYGAMYAAQVVGGPDWLDKEAYNIKGKVPDELEAALQKMKPDEQQNQTRAMQQSLLVDRFQLKAHFETRVLPVYELVPAKGGLKITEVPAPPERKPGDPPLQMHPGDPLPPGTIRTMMNSNGLRAVDARAIPMTTLARMIGGPMSEVGDRPVVDHTGFTGYLDIKALTWAPIGNAGATDAPDAPSLTGALEKQLGIKLVPAKDPIEVLVIDSIDRPSPD
jgi:bla regulator protein BlaR1